MAATITVDGPTSTTPFDQAGLVAAGWKFDSTSTFTITGTPAGGNFCISGYNSGATANATTKQWKYVENGGGLQSTTGAGCS